MKLPNSATLARDVPASIVVFLVAMPLCMGIAIASGVSVEKGLMTGIIGGIVVGLLAGSPLQVSGPAAGLAVIVFEFVTEYGISALGPVLLLAGLIQLAAGLLRLGQWFRAISPAVVHGMLAGIGVLIVAAQFQIMFDAKPSPSGLQNLAAIPAAFAGLPGQRGAALALLVGLGTIAAMLGWEKLRPQRLRFLPGALIGVASGTLIAFFFRLPVQRVSVPDAILADSQVTGLADLARLAEPGILLSAVIIAIIASAETLLSAAAVDRMHKGARTQYDRELAAQGIGNFLCGFLGALPMTGVIVRSSANVQAGAATRMSTILHGVWILGIVALLPWLLREIPTAALAGVLVVTGWRLVSLRHVRELLHHHGILPVAIWIATLVMIIATDLLTGVLVGLALSVVEILPHLRALPLRVQHHEEKAGEAELRLTGAATFVQLRRLQQALEAVSHAATIRLKVDQLVHIDHTCAEFLSDWVRSRAASGKRVELHSPIAKPYARRLAAVLAG